MFLEWHCRRFLIQVAGGQRESGVEVAYRQEGKGSGKGAMVGFVMIVPRIKIYYCKHHHTVRRSDRD